MTSEYLKKKHDLYRVKRFEDFCLSMQFKMRCINWVYLVIHKHSISEIIKQTCCGARCVLSFWRHSASVCSFTLTKHPHVPLSRTKIVSATLPRAWTSLTWQADLCACRCLTACACLCPWFVSSNCQRLLNFLNLLLLAHNACKWHSI